MDASFNEFAQEWRITSAGETTRTTPNYIPTVAATLEPLSAYINNPESPIFRETNIVDEANALSDENIHALVNRIRQVEGFNSTTVWHAGVDFAYTVDYTAPIRRGVIGLMLGKVSLEDIKKVVVNVALVLSAPVWLPIACVAYAVSLWAEGRMSRDEEI